MLKNSTVIRESGLLDFELVQEIDYRMYQLDPEIAAEFVTIIENACKEVASREGHAGYLVNNEMLEGH